MTTYAAALNEARAALRAAGVESPALDARLLLCDAARIDSAALIANGNDPLPDLARQCFDRHLQRRVSGEPVARIVGYKEFWGLPFEVTPATLVPRADTETLVEAVLAELRGRHHEQLSICDLGTGSGAILLALLRELPNARGLGVDISPAAVEASRSNAAALAFAERSEFRVGDFARQPDGFFDVIVSNPPYIRSAAIAGLERDVRDYEPRVALDGGADGLDAYRSILSRARLLLNDTGFVAFEVGFDQSDAVTELCRANMLNQVAVTCDLAGVRRVVLARPGAKCREADQGTKILLGNAAVPS